ncbi:MAG: DNA pilot protein [Microviridae sp.]|nr:MAG: DNA pilot protein [Microviridae sp.]
MAFPVAGAIAAGAALVGQGAQMVATGKLNKKNRQWQEDMWNKTNAYNDPSAQRARMEAAGMNPALMYGGGQGGGTTTMPNAPKQENQNMSGFGEAAMKFQAAKMQTMQIDQVQKAIEVADTQKQLNQANTIKSISEANMTDEQKKQLVDSFDVKLQNLYSDLNVKNQGIEVAQTSIKKMEADIANSTTMTEANKAKISQEVKNLEQQIAESTERIKQMKIEGNLKGAQAVGQRFQNQILSSQADLWNRGINPFAPAKDQIIKGVLDAGGISDALDGTKTTVDKVNKMYDTNPLLHATPYGQFKKWLKQK